MPTEAADSLAELEPAALEEEKDSVEPQSDGNSIPLEGSDESSAGAPGTTVATPGGDNEFVPDQPLEPISEGRERPPATETNEL